MSRVKLDDDLTDKLRGKAKLECRSLTNLANVLLRRLVGMKIAPKKRTKEDL